MANTKSKVSTKKTVKTAPAEPATVVSTEKRTYKVKSELDPNMIVTVKNGFNGMLVYTSTRSGETFRWDSFGDEQDMELQELKNARNSSKDFFINNWFLIDDPEIIEYLGVTKYYENSLSFDGFNELLEKSPSEIESIIKNMPKGQKDSLKYRAKQLIAEGEIDSIKVINAIEKGLSVELIER